MIKFKTLGLKKRKPRNIKICIKYFFDVGKPLWIFFIAILPLTWALHYFIIQGESQKRWANDRTVSVAKLLSV